MMNIDELLKNKGNDGSRFQSDLAIFIIDNNLDKIVETGSGTSTLHILKAMEMRGSGMLYSIDPEPFCGYEITHPQYRLIKKRSREALADLYKEIGAFDLFLHDSDHDIACQTYEYDMALQCVKGGGYIFSDDYEWNSHFSWATFLKNNDLHQFIVGNIAGTRINTDPAQAKDIKKISTSLWKNALLKEERWLSDGNRNTWDIVYEGTNRKQ